jgi:hypothetical protein
MINTEQMVTNNLSEDIVKQISNNIVSYLYMTPEEREIYDTKERLKNQERVKEMNEIGYEDQWGVYHKGSLPNCVELYHRKYYQK